jgi:signal transduction histidine kinase
MIRRLQRLSATGARIGEGALGQRVAEGVADEIGQLERQFNVMAERLESARATERQAIEEETRTSERSRIARELHDAVSQDLFSLGMVAGGLEKALPEGDLRDKARAMRETAEEAMRGMSELLLELRPSTLEEGGLVFALTQLADAYRSRLGISIDAEIEDVRVTPESEHAFLRLAQEGLSNAVRHADARHIGLRLTSADGRATLTVSDDGRGFRPDDVNGHGLGLGAMRDRVGELGGGLDVVSAPRHGTTVSAWLPTER